VPPANAFFASYQTMILNYAQVAVANGATSLCNSKADLRGRLERRRFALARLTTFLARRSSATTWRRAYPCSAIPARSSKWGGSDPLNRIGGALTS